jgi:hypothetical protein
MSVPICITKNDYLEKSREILDSMRTLTEEEKVQLLANTLESFWHMAVMYEKELDGSHGYGR